MEKQTILPPFAYYELVSACFLEAGNPNIAQQQQAYMKFHFDFYGLKMPVWTAIAKEIHKANGVHEGAELHELARLCFSSAYREMHYFALETLQKRIKKQPETAITLLEELITTHSWWDSVDWLAKLVGIHFRRFPDQVLPVTEAWMNSGNIWLQRVCIIFQLTYKRETDTDLLLSYILKVANTKEFFLQKAAGWALRQHSKTDPDLVKNFIENHKLPPLTRREGLRLLVAK